MFSTGPDKTCRFDSFSFVSDSIKNQEIATYVYPALDFAVTNLSANSMLPAQPTRARSWNSFISYDQLAMLARHVSAFSALRDSWLRN